MASSKQLHRKHVEKASKKKARKMQRLAQTVKGKTGKTGTSVMRALPQLPIEVLDNVIDHLWDDQEALRECRLVCRAWYPPGCLHFFRQIKIKTVKGVKAKAKVLKQTPELSNRVHNMTIWGMDTIVGFETYHTDLSALSLAAILLARKLPRLETLEIRDSQWKPWTMHKDIFLHLSGFSVTCLFLSDVTFPSVTVLGRLICALPHLVELHCLNPHFTHYHFHHDTFGLYRNRVKIRTLSVLAAGYAAVPGNLIDFLAHPCISSHLQRCIICVNLFRNGRYKGGFQQLLNAASGSLLELQLDLKLVRSKRQTDTEMSAADSVLSLNQNISLQRLWLCLEAMPQDSDLDSLRQALVSIKSGELREIVILFMWPSSSTDIIEGVKNVFKNHDSAHLEAMDDYLSSDLFRTLSRVEFVLSLHLWFNGRDANGAEEQWKQTFASLFPRLTERGIFRATVRDWNYSYIF